MMNSLAILLLTIPFEDILILQLGADDFLKREAATKTLDKILQDTDGCRNYSVLLKVKKTRDNKDAEVRRRASDLYERNHVRYFREYPCFYIFTVDFDKEGQTVAAQKKAASISEGFKGIRWGHRQGEGFAILCVTPKDFNSDKIAKIKSHNEVTRIVPVKEDQEIPWRRFQK